MGVAVVNISQPFYLAHINKIGPGLFPCNGHFLHPPLASARVISEEKDGFFTTLQAKQETS
jgi:hypothetical protein